MRHFSSTFVSSSSRLTAVVGACLVSLCAATASAAEPTTTTTEVTAPAGSPVVVVNTAPAPAAPVADPAWVVPVQPAPAPAPVPTSSRIAVDFHPHPMAAPTIEQQIYSRKVAEVSRARGLRVAGWATLGSTYGFSALIGTIAIDTSSRGPLRNYGYSMLIPVAGPFMAAFNSRSATGGLLTVSLGVAQAAGLGMAIVGGMRHRRLQRELTLTAMPTQGGGQVGMSMRF